MIPAVPGMKWPELKILRISENEKNKLSTFIEKELTVNCEEPFRNYLKSEYFMQLPVSFCFLYNSEKRVKHVILLLNRARGPWFEGGQRKPKLAYDLMTGKLCMKKREAERTPEGDLVKQLMNDPKENIVKILGIRIINNKKQYFEEFYGHDMRYWVGKPRLEGYHNKILIMRKLLIALQNFSQYQSTKVYQDVAIEFSCFHNDLKIDNILINEENDVALTDFGLSNLVDTVGFSPYYGHPQKLLMRGRSRQEIAVQHVKYGHRMDMWSLGVVFVVILTNRLQLNGMPALPFLDDLFHPDYKFRVNKKPLTQERINEELDQLRKRTEHTYQGKIMDALWGLVIEMLRLEAEEIPTADAVLEKLNKLIASSVKALAGPLEALQRIEFMRKELEDKLKEIRSSVP